MVHAGRRGFTLSEILIALMLITLAVLGLMGVRIYAIRAESASPDKQTASLIAVSKMSEAEQKLREGVPHSQISEAETQDPVHERFRYSVNVGLHTDYTNLVDVDVTVTWKDEPRTGVYKLHSRFTQI